MYPEDEGSKCIKADVTNSNWASKKNSSVILYDIAESKADVDCKVVEYKNYGDLAEERTMKIRVQAVRYNGEEQKSWRD